ncbi:MAG: hypothetical protein IPN57_09505 [Ignavibacteria bacterium]|nr:hypothetical protein [Ignavibacteria bacterium]
MENLNEKMKYFLNISNHPSDKWGDKQLSTALELAEEIINLPFPNINPEWDQVARTTKNKNRKLKTLKPEEDGTNKR